MSKMLMSYAWCRIRGQHLSGVLAHGNDSIRFLASDVSQQQKRFYAKGKDTECCKDQPQTKGRRLEHWPKAFDSAHPPWKTECPSGAPPPNNDPYRIKVPDIMVPPLPTTSAKWLGVLSFDDRSSQQGPYGSGYGPQQPYPSNQQQSWGTDQWGNPIPQQGQEKEEGGILGMLKGLFGLNKKDKSNPYNIVSV